MFEFKNLINNILKLKKSNFDIYNIDFKYLINLFKENSNSLDKSYYFYYWYGKVLNIYVTSLNKRNYDDQCLFKDNIKDVLKNYNLSFKMFQKSLSIYNKKFNIKDDICSFFDSSYINKFNYLDEINKEIKEVSYNLADIYYNIGDEDNFVKYGKIASKYNSLDMSVLMLSYFCDKDDYDNVFKYFDRTKNIDNDFEKMDIALDKRKIVNNKIVSYFCVFDYLYDKGEYKKSKETIFELKSKFNNMNYFNYINPKTINKIDEYIKKAEDKINKLNCNNYCFDLLDKYFDSNIISLMSNEVKIYINTSLFIYKMVSSNSDMIDYSCVLMPIMKAVESILYDIIVNNYFEYLKSNNKFTKEQIPKEFLDINNNNNKYFKIKNNIDRLEYGSALYCIAKKNNKFNNYIPNELFIDFCKDNNIKNPRSVIYNFAEYLNKIRNKRNLVAHKNRVIEEDADICYNVLLDKIKFIDFLYSNFKFCFENK